MAYNGWTNFQTWAVNVWLGDDEEWLQSLREMELYEAGQEIKRRLDDMKDDAISEDSSLMRDLLTSAIEEVNIHELATSWLEEE